MLLSNDCEPLTALRSRTEFPNNDAGRVPHSSAMFPDSVLGSRKEKEDCESLAGISGYTFRSVRSDYSTATTALVGESSEGSLPHGLRLRCPLIALELSHIQQVIGYRPFQREVPLNLCETATTSAHLHDDDDFLEVDIGLMVPHNSMLHLFHFPRNIQLPFLLRGKTEHYLESSQLSVSDSYSTDE